MPDAPVIITPGYTPTTPAAPVAPTGNFTPTTPAVPAVITPAFAGSAPAAPAAVSANYQAALAGFRMVIAEMEIDVVLVPAFGFDGDPAGLSNTGRVDPVPGTRVAVAQTVGDVWTVLIWMGEDQEGSWTAAGAGGEASPDLVAVWTPDAAEPGVPVFTATRGTAWPPVLGTDYAGVAPTAPSAITSNYVPGTPAAPPVITP